jgi:2-keto-3-deoxy-6-phosphogluconate aldolase
MKSWLEPIPLVAILRGRHPGEAVDIDSALVVVGFRVLEVPIKSPRLFDNIRRLIDDAVLFVAGCCRTASATRIRNLVLDSEQADLQ